MRRKKRENKAGLLSLPGLFLLIVAVAATAISTDLTGRPGLLFAGDAASVENQKTTDSKLEDFLEDDGFVYTREGRPDPFMPFLTTTTKAAKPEVEEELTGMRKFEPGQLNLVAIVFAGDEKMAMVQDSVGKGYVIRKGTNIGRSGVVEDIVTNRVIIDNISYTRAGEKRVTTVEMLLKQKGDER